MSEYGWKGKQVRNADGRIGTVCDEWAGFMHVALSIDVEGGERAHVQLNSDGRDCGETGWQWLCENFSGGPHWLPLGDHSGTAVETQS